MTNQYDTVVKFTLYLSACLSTWSTWRSLSRTLKRIPCIKGATRRKVLLFYQATKRRNRAGCSTERAPSSTYHSHLATFPRDRWPAVILFLRKTVGVRRAQRFPVFFSQHFRLLLLLRLNAPLGGKRATPPMLPYLSGTRCTGIIIEQQTHLLVRHLYKERPLRISPPTVWTLVCILCT